MRRFDRVFTGSFLSILMVSVVIAQPRFRTVESNPALSTGESGEGDTSIVYLTHVLQVNGPNYDGTGMAVSRNETFQVPSGNSPYLLYPEKNIGYVDTCAAFWLNIYDPSDGGFFSDVDKYGNTLSTNKHMMSQSRNAYGFTRAYMLTGNDQYLEMADSALAFLYEHAWDTQYGGWFADLNQFGNPLYPQADKTAFYQHYALLGIAAFFEATRDSNHWDWLMQGFDHLENLYWDSSPSKGYFDVSDYTGRNPRNKSFNATVDAITTNLLYLYLMTEDNFYLERLKELAAEIISHFVGSMPAQAIGFVEHYDSYWNWDNSQIRTEMGHILKAAWCLVRINNLEANTEYIESAEILVQHVWDNGYDQKRGGPLSNFDRTTGDIITFGWPDTLKSFWEMEQAITAGLMLFAETRDSLYWQLADETIDFYMTHFFDRVYGEVYLSREDDGDFAFDENKGGSGKAAYHSIELGYYAYLYTELLVNHDPVTLYYNFNPEPVEKTYLLTPVADLAIQISTVNPETVSFNDCSVIVPAGVGGEFAVTFVYGPPSSIAGNQRLQPSQFSLEQNYPNPFNPITAIGYQLSAVSDVELSVYNLLGQKVATLVNGRQPAGTYQVEWNASHVASGVYYYQLRTSTGFIQTKKLILLK